MARTNKFTSINFNDIFEKKANPNPNPNPKSSSSSSPLTQTPYSSSLHKPHGGMLVLTRPTPKPLHPQNPKPQPQPQPSPAPAPALHQSQSEPDSSNPISLRPQVPQESKKEPEPHPIPAATPFKPEPFVPPHLRPGFAGKEEKFGANGQRIQNPIQNQNSRSVEIGVPNGFAENGRPRTVGGYERMRRGGGGGGGGGEYDGVVANDVNRPSGGYGGNRPRSSGGGTRPGSASANRPGGGWYGASYRSPTHH